MLPRLLTCRRLATGVAVAAALVTLAAPPASAATGLGASASVSTRVDDPDDTLGRAGNVHLVQLGVVSNPEGDVVSGEITSYDCETGQPLSACDRVALNRLVAAGPVSITVKGDGSAVFTARVAEVRARDGRQLRVFDVDATVTSGTLAIRRNCVCGFTASDGTTYTQKQFFKQWTGSTASGTVGVFPLVPASAAATTGKYWVSSSVPA